MPQHEEHCEHSFKRYGIRGDDIHTWIDEPSKIDGYNHRRFRHSVQDIPIAVEIFGKKYGAEIVENIFLDHLKADSEEQRKNGNNNDETEEKYYGLSFEDFEKLCRYSEKEKKWKIDASDKTTAWSILMDRTYPKIWILWIKRLETKRLEQLFKEQKYSNF